VTKREAMRMLGLKSAAFFNWHWNFVADAA
jgi:hypothetical protein